MSNNSDLPVFRLWLNTGAISVPTFPRNRRGPLVAHLNALFGGDESRHLFLEWSFGRRHINNLIDAEKWQLWKWLDPQPVSTLDTDGRGIWTIRPQCYTTAAAWRAEQARDIISKVHFIAT